MLTARTAGWLRQGRTRSRSDSRAVLSTASNYGRRLRQWCRTLNFRRNEGCPFGATAYPVADPEQRVHGVAVQGDEPVLEALHAARRGVTGRTVPAVQLGEAAEEGPAPARMHPALVADHDQQMADHEAEKSDLEGGIDLAGAQPLLQVVVLLEGLEVAVAAGRGDRG